MLPLLLLSCGKQGGFTDTLGNAAGSASPVLAREVVGIHMLSADTDYREPCHYVTEGLIKQTFGIDHDAELIENTQANGCTFEWDGRVVRIAFGGHKPYASVYHAEYAFDKRYQPKQAGVTSGLGGADGPAEAASGPNPAGTAGSVGTPAQIPGNKRDSTMANDTSRTPAHITPRASMPTEKAESQGAFVAMKGIGDKALWEPGRNTIHVLYNNHIINVQIMAGETQAKQKQQAAMLARVLIDGLSH
ncbi:hypothetical protein [Arsenicibacter rosenii]|nr:hypothetical protein [Arsenicibacter rosenii]